MHGWTFCRTKLNYGHNEIIICRSLLAYFRRIKNFLLTTKSDSHCRVHSAFWKYLLILSADWVISQHAREASHPTSVLT
jgi:hypothetical protein